MTNNAPHIAVLIPLYNHGATVRNVAERALLQCENVWVIDDGSTDGGADTLADLPVHILHLAQNGGKGAALMAGAKALQEAGFTHMITLDADNQHYPEDIPHFVKAIQNAPHAFIVGARDFTVPNVPKSSRFGRAFSEFWMFVQTGQRVNDMQSGYRAYPLQALLCLTLRESRYSFEIEVLVNAAWSGFAINEIPINVYYQTKEERVSHFKALADNVRISIMNTRLTVRALIPVPFRRHALSAEGGISLLSPLASLRLLLLQSTPRHIAYSAAVSLFICTLPLLGLQSILLLYAINSLKLNRLCALVLIPLTWPPFVPGICVLLGYRVWHGAWLTEFSVQTLGYEAGQRLFEWVVGSIVLAPFLGICMGALVGVLAFCVKKTSKKLGS